MRRTVEVIVETEELLVVKRRGPALPLWCPACGAMVEPPLLEAEAVSPDLEGLDAPENPQVAASRLIRRFQE